MKDGNKLSLTIKILLTAVFGLSVIGKAIDVTASAFTLSQLFFIPSGVAKLAVYLLIIVEIGAVVLVWQRTPRWLLVLPVGFLGVLIYGSWMGVDCGCFGSFPMLSKFPPSAHFLLIVGLFLGIFYLSTPPKRTQDSSAAFEKLLPTIGIGGAALLIISFLMVPFANTEESQANASVENLIVDMAFVKNAIVEQNAIIVDARSKMQYMFGHIDGAVNVPVDDSDVEALVETHRLRDKPLILYCTSAECDMAERLSEKLFTFGLKEIKIYSGGWEEWEMENY